MLLGIVPGLEMESVFAASAKEVISPVISFGQLPLRSTLAFVIEKERRASLCCINNLD